MSSYRLRTKLSPVGTSHLLIWPTLGGEGEWMVFGLGNSLQCKSDLSLTLKEGDQRQKTLYLLHITVPTATPWPYSGPYTHTLQTRLEPPQGPPTEVLNITKAAQKQVSEIAEILSTTLRWEILQNVSQIGLSGLPSRLTQQKYLSILKLWLVYKVFKTVVKDYFYSMFMAHVSTCP